MTSILYCVWKIADNKNLFDLTFLFDKPARRRSVARPKLRWRECCGGEDRILRDQKWRCFLHAARTLQGLLY